jgi:CHAT domain-containing protein/Tfp pilus assembly protein PilF
MGACLLIPCAVGCDQWAREDAVPKLFAIFCVYLLTLLTDALSQSPASSESTSWEPNDLVVDLNVTNPREWALQIASAVYGGDAENLLKLGRHSDADPLLKRSVDIRHKKLGVNHPDVPRTSNALADLYDVQERHGAAETIRKRVPLTSENRLENRPYSGHLPSACCPVFAQRRDELLELSKEAYALYQAGNYAKAIPFAQRALAITEKVLGPNHPEVAEKLSNLASLFFKLERYADAEPLYKRALAIRMSALGPDHLTVASDWNNLALLYDALGRYPEAIMSFQRALAIEEKALGSNHVDVAPWLQTAATAYIHDGQYEAAERLCKRSLTIYEKALGADNPRLTGSLLCLGGIYREEYRYADAEPLFKRTITILEKSHDPRLAVSLDHLAALYEGAGRYAEAEPLFKRALSIREKILGPDNLETSLSLNNLAVVYHNQHRYPEAESLYKRVLAIQEKTLGPDHPDVAKSLYNLAILYDKQGRYADAESFYTRSSALLRKSLAPNHPRVVEVLFTEALFYAEHERYADAARIVRRTIPQDHRDKSIALNVLYGAESKNLIGHVEALESSYTLLQRSSASSAGKAVSLLSARFASGSTELARLVRKQQDLVAEADRLDKDVLAAVSKPSGERNFKAEELIHNRITQIERELDKLQDIFTKQFPDYVTLSRPQPLSVNDTQALLASDEAVIAFDFNRMPYEDTPLISRGYVWVITNDQAEWRELSIRAEDIDKDVATLRAGLDPESFTPFDQNLAYQLYRQILGPIEGIISQKSRLSFLLSGALTSLPPQVLITNNPERKDFASFDWLARKYAITILPSVASLKVLRGKAVAAAVKPILGFGDPIFNRSKQRATSKVPRPDRSLPMFYRGLIADTKALGATLPALPETADELRAVAKDLGANPEDIRLGETASVTNVKHSPLDNYRVVYFATHALVAGEVEKFAKVKAEPALVLSIPEKPTDEDDGLLRASDVAMLKMNADFVVLSACNTAAGDKPGAEALSGLARAFFYAGARSLIVSNWEVDSESTVALMTGMFDALKHNPHLTHAEALRLSMLRMIDKPSKPEWTEPKYWAPFIVVGEPQKT